jgi:tryptophanyl-tRNA synthetase
MADQPTAVTVPKALSEAVVESTVAAGVTPWTACDTIDYNKLIDSWGAKFIEPELIARLERAIGEPAHPWLRRGLFFSHRDLDHILDLYESGEPFYLYTGRGPSSESLHLGHLVPFQFTQWLQRVFNVPLVIQLTDDEKFLWKPYLTLAEAARLGFENAKDIIACGFDLQKTFMFRDTDFIRYLYPTSLKIARCVTYNKAVGTFGFEPSDHIGKVSFPPIQAAPSFSSCFPFMFGGREDVQCLIPCAIDQDPYFRMTREVAPTLGWKKPALVHSRFFPGLLGAKSKMSASTAATTIYVTDTPEEVAAKIKQHAVSGGRETLQEHRELGGNCDDDVSYQYLTFFERDDALLERYRTEFTAGRMLSMDMKQALIDVLVPLVLDFQRRRAAVTDEMVEAFMTIREFKY